MKTIHFMKYALLSFSLFFFISTHAQIKLEANGRFNVGNVFTLKSTDPENVANMHIWGKYGDYRSGSKLTFGDFGDQVHNSWNVFIGEYTNDDTDKLWLHGKNGIYLTHTQGYSSQIIGYYDLGVGNRFNFNCEVYSSGVKLASDERFKENIQTLEGSLSSLQKLNGVSYNLNGLEKGLANTQLRAGAAQNSDGSQLSDKEKRDMAFAEQWSKEQAEKQKQDRHLGFVAQDIKKVFPELVSEGKDGYLFVDYIGLIPVIVEGLKEQSHIIEAQSQKIKELEALVDKNDNNNFKSSITGASPIVTDNTTNAFLYQNAPNPFTDVTTIRYFLPESVKNAFIYIFDMQGNLLKKYPINKQGQLEISGSGLKAGMYLYSLIVDGKEADTKRMILTK